MLGRTRSMHGRDEIHIQHFARGVYRKGRIGSHKVDWRIRISRIKWSRGSV